MLKSKETILCVQLILTSCPNMGSPLASPTTLQRIARGCCWRVGWEQPNIQNVSGLEVYLHDVCCAKWWLIAVPCGLSCCTSLDWTRCTRARWRWRERNSMWRALTVSPVPSRVTWMQVWPEPPQGTRSLVLWKELSMEAWPSLTGWSSPLISVGGF